MIWFIFKHDELEIELRIRAANLDYALRILEEIVTDSKEWNEI